MSRYLLRYQNKPIALWYGGGFLIQGLQVRVLLSAHLFLLKSNEFLQKLSLYRGKKHEIVQFRTLSHTCAVYVSIL